MEWTNPFANFLNVARSEILKIQSEPDVRSDASLRPQFVKIVEDRSFVLDIVDRAETLATAFNRLRELYELYVSFDTDRWKCIEEQRASDPGRVAFHVASELEQGLNRCHSEAQTLTTFAYYELSTLVSLPGAGLSPAPQSLLEYLVGVRNKILVHPRRDGRVKSSNSALTIGPILIAHLVGAESWSPLIRDWNREILRAHEPSLDDEAGAEANVALLRQRKRRVDEFTAAEILRLKSYRIPEPDLLGSAREMASLLQTKVLPEITRACAVRVK